MPKPQCRASKFIFLALILAVLSQCRAREETPLFRFIDHVSQKNVISSPLKSLHDVPSSKPAENSSLSEIADVFPLEDLGIGQNPYLVKKKLRVGAVDFNALAAVPQSHFRIPLKIPGDSVLEFGIGIRKDKEIFLASEGARNVDFQVILETENSKKEIFNKSLSLLPHKPFIFDIRRIKLSAYAGQKATFHFLTRGDAKALAVWFCPVLYQSNPGRKNIILISLDTLRADHLSCYGYNRPTSPAIDSLAKDSALFLNTYASSPWTLPSHLSIMTALHTINHQVYSRESRLDPSLPTLAELLKAKGFYNIAFTGGGYVSGFYGFHKGFESYNVTADALGRDGAGRLWEAASRWIDDNKAKSFFLFLHTYQIHDPYFSPPPYNEWFAEPGEAPSDLSPGRLRLHKENRFEPLPEATRRSFIKLYDGEIRYTDEVLIKPLVEKLRGIDLYDRTMIILTSDHGEEFYEHKGWLHNHTVYNEAIKVPLIIKFFGSRFAGRRVEEYVRSVDIMPTVLEELGIKYSEKKMDGRSLPGLLKKSGDHGSREERVFVCDLGSHAESKSTPMKVSLNRGRFKLIVNERYSPDDLKYYSFPPPPLEETELFDLSNDPGEKTNLAGKKPALVRELIRGLRSWYKPRIKTGSPKTNLHQEILDELRSLGYL